MAKSSSAGISLTVTSDPVRADAARNTDRVVRAARDAYAEIGPHVSMHAIAIRAGLNERTLYRRIHTKGELARVVTDYYITESLSPAIEAAPHDHDPLRGLTGLIEAAILLSQSNCNALIAARAAGVVTDGSSQFLDVVGALTRRAQQAGLMRPDVGAEDVIRILAILHSVLGSTQHDFQGWRRYLRLMLVYGLGYYAFEKLLEDWRLRGDLDGLIVST